MISDGTASTTSAQPGGLPHICVCICTYKRPLPLRRLLNELEKQATGGAFTYSAVVADNDATASARATVEEFAAAAALRIAYCVEPRQGIARARNAVLAQAKGDYLAFIDDDEFPVADWLLTLFTQCNRYDVDGVLGPVKRHFDAAPPQWLLDCTLCDRRVLSTGTAVEWSAARTGNVLIRRRVVEGDAVPFRPELKASEDQDFFRRKMEAGFRFIWSAEAVAYEVVPPSRWKRSYFLKRSLLHGAMAVRMGRTETRELIKSLAAVPLYLLLLPWNRLRGQHRSMDTLIRLCFHLGRLLALLGFDSSGQYLED
jgi:succinoglycan biosynthesis protein ExoM